MLGPPFLLISLLLTNTKPSPQDLQAAQSNTCGPECWPQTARSLPQPVRGPPQPRLARKALAVTARSRPPPPSHDLKQSSSTAANLESACATCQPRLSEALANSLSNPVTLGEFSSTGANSTRHFSAHLFHSLSYAARAEPLPAGSRNVL